MILIPLSTTFLNPQTAGLHSVKCFFSTLSSINLLNCGDRHALALTQTIRTAASPHVGQTPGLRTSRISPLRHIKQAISIFGFTHSEKGKICTKHRATYSKYNRRATAVISDRRVKKFVYFSTLVTIFRGCSSQVYTFSLMSRFTRLISTHPTLF